MNFIHNLLIAEFYQHKIILWPKPIHSEKYFMKKLFYHILWYLSLKCFSNGQHIFGQLCPYTF